MEKFSSLNQLSEPSLSISELFIFKNKEPFSLSSDYSLRMQFKVLSLLILSKINLKWSSKRKKNLKKNSRKSKNKPLKRFRNKNNFCHRRKEGKILRRGLVTKRVAKRMENRQQANNRRHKYANSQFQRGCMLWLKMIRCSKERSYYVWRYLLGTVDVLSELINFLKKPV